MGSKMSKTVLISGANGYFGGIACRYFRESGWNVLKATRQHDADIYLDLDKPEEFACISAPDHIDLFIHAAAAHEVMCVKSPYLSIFQNIAGTKAALEFCVNNKIDRFIYISTFHVYGNPIGQITEDIVPLPVNDYGLSHLQAEEYVQMYSMNTGLKGTVLRPSNFYGIPADMHQFNRWTLTPLAFCREAIITKRIQLNTPGLQKRNFVSIHDICLIIDKIYNCNVSLPLLNICGPDTISIKDLAKSVISTLDSEFKIAVELVVPDGNNSGTDFTYSSNYINDIYPPTQNIYDFITKFVREHYSEIYSHAI